MHKSLVVVDLWFALFPIRPGTKAPQMSMKLKMKLPESDQEMRKKMEPKPRAEDPILEANGACYRLFGRDRKNVLMGISRYMSCLWVYGC